MIINIGQNLNIHVYIFFFSVCVFLCVSVSFSPSLSVRVERGCAVGVLLQCRQKPDSPIHYYSLCLFARVCQQYWRLERQSSSAHAQTHSELIDPVPLSRKTFPLCPASTSTHPPPPPPPSWLNAYYLPLSVPLHFPYWHPSFSLYLYSSSSSFSSHSASFPPLCFPHCSYPSRASLAGQTEDPERVFPDPLHTYSSALFKSKRALSSLWWFCDVEATFPLTWPLRSWPPASKVGGNLLLTFWGLSLCFTSSYHFTSCYTGNRLFIPPVKWHLIITFFCHLF